MPSYYGIHASDPLAVSPDKVRGLLVISDSWIAKDDPRLIPLITSSEPIGEVGHPHDLPPAVARQRRWVWARDQSAGQPPWASQDAGTRRPCSAISSQNTAVSAPSSRAAGRARYQGS